MVSLPPLQRILVDLIILVLDQDPSAFLMTALNFLATPHDLLRSFPQSNLPFLLAGRLFIAALWLDQDDGLEIFETTILRCGFLILYFPYCTPLHVGIRIIFL